MKEKDYDLILPDKEPSILLLAPVEVPKNK